MPILQSLTIKGYKSIRELQDFPLTSLNVLIGANGAGKSNFISFFRLLNQIYEKNLQLYVQVQGGPDALLHFGRDVTEEITLEVYFEKNQFYQCNLIPTNDNRLLFKREKAFYFDDENDETGLMETNPVESGYIVEHSESQSINSLEPLFSEEQNLITKIRIYHFHDTSDKAKVKQKHPSNDNLVLKPDAANLAPYLLMLRNKHPVEYRRIVDTIRLAIPFFKDFVLRVEDDKFESIQLEWTQKGHSDTPFKAHVLSDGTLRFICLTTLLLQPTALLPETILIDEPELGLHPYAITLLASMFRQVAETKQLIVATQSVELVNELSPTDVIVVEQEDNASTFKRFSEAELAGWLEEYSLGELWNMNILGGRP